MQYCNNAIMLRHSASTRCTFLVTNNRAALLLCRKKWAFRQQPHHKIVQKKLPRATLQLASSASPVPILLPGSTLGCEDVQDLMHNTVCQELNIGLTSREDMKVGDIRWARAGRICKSHNRQKSSTDYWKDRIIIVLGFKHPLQQVLLTLKHISAPNTSCQWQSYSIQTAMPEIVLLKPPKKSA